MRIELDSILNWTANETKSSIGTPGSGKESSRGLSTRDLVYIAVLAAIWAGSENVLGGQLHAMNIPFNGIPLAAIAVFLMVTGRSLVPRAGSTILMGIVVALLKILSIGGVVLSPMIAIFMEALLVELTMTVGGANQLASSIGGMLTEMWSFAHPFVIQPLLFGGQILVIYEKTILAGSNLLGVDPTNVILIILVILVLHGVVGVIAGVAGWRFSSRAKRILSR
jgi:hypothetical protein